MAHIETRRTKDGKTRYRAQVSLKGYPSQSATFERKTDAKRWAQQTEAAIREGRHFKTTEAKRHTFRELVDRYIKDVIPTKGEQRHTQRAQLEWWRSRIGDYTLADVTPALIAECRDELLNGTTRTGRRRSPATANRYLAALSHCFSVAVREWGWLDDSPMRKVRRPQEPRGRDRLLSDDERARLLNECQAISEPLYTIAVIALSTGARHGEIVGLKWEDVDLQRGAIILRKTKNKEIRAVPLAGLALKLIKELGKVRRIDSKFVFPGRRPGQPFAIRSPWARAVKAAGIENFRFHDLRHAAASYLAMNGATLAEIAEILGHKTLQMVRRYSHMTERHTAKVVAKMNRQIFGGST